MWGDRNRVFIDVSVVGLDDDDLEQLEEQADELGWLYFRRERQHASHTLHGLAGIARNALDERHGSMSEDDDTVIADWWSIAIEFDPTSNPEQSKDELGTVMARTMALAERDDISDELASVWFRVVRQLARERDRLRQDGVIL